MVAEVLFAGGRAESVAVLSGTVVDSTASGYFDSTYTDAGLSVGQAYTDMAAFFLYTQSGGVLSTTTVVSGESFFLHFEARISQDSNTANEGVTLRDSAGFPWVKLRTSNTLLGVYYNSGTGASPVWTLSGTAVTFGSSAGRVIFDVEVIIGSPHAVNVYTNGNLVIGTTFTQASFTNIARVLLQSLGRNITAPYTAYSQILATRDLSTVGSKVKTCRATGAGNYTQWTGTFASVNEAVGNDVTLQNAATAGLISTHAMGDVTVPSGFEIRSVFHWLRAKNDGTGPTNIKSKLRSSGADYTTADLSGIGLGYAPVGARYDSDPLGSNWTAAVWNAIEAGYEAAT